VSDAIQRIKDSLKADPYLVHELGEEEGVEIIAEEIYDTTRWGVVHLAVYRDTSTGDLVGVFYETVPEEGLLNDTIGVYPVEAKTVTTYVRKP
jgi:hypothetical protein